MAKLHKHLLERSFASQALDLVKMKAFTPCDIDDPLTRYKSRMIEVVFDPLNIEEVNNRFKSAGYTFDDGMKVIAVNADGSILLWGGFNSVYHLQKGERIIGAFDNLAFEDILDLTLRFKIKNKKVEIDALIADLRKKYSSDESSG